MKKFTAVFLGITLALCALLLFPNKVNAATSGITGACTWSLDGTTLTISGVGAMAEYSWNNKPWGKDITHVIIEEGVTRIGQFAFYSCSKLQSVSIASTVTQIGDQAFDRSGLQSITIPEGVTTIEQGAFNTCTSLNSIILPSSLTYIGDYAFQSCPATSIVFSTNLKYIGASAFNYGNIKDVWYLGEQADKAALTIKGYNACLNTATWHYNSCPIGAPHSYSGICDSSCNECGKLRTASSHTYDSICDDDCNGCGEQRTVPNHVYDTPCDVFCNNCGNSRTVSHNYDNNCDADCNACGGIRTVTHHYSDSWSHNENTHWHTCTLCGDKTTQNAHTPGTAATETTSQSCIYCGYIIVPALGHIHNHDTNWSNNTTSHWHACNCGDQKDYAEHIYTDDCDTTCNTCEFVRTVNHTPGPEATATTDQVCTVCGAVLVKAPGENQVISPPTEPSIQVTEPTTLPNTIPTNPSASTPQHDASVTNSAHSDWLLYSLFGIGCIVLIAGIALWVTKKKTKHT